MKSSPRMDDKNLAYAVDITTVNNKLSMFVVLLKVKKR